MADDRQAALGAIDPKGNIVLKEFGDTALLFRPQNNYEPFVVASGYDKENGEWASGSYFSDLGYAWEKANPEIAEEACIRWQRDDIATALQDQGFAASKENISWMMGNDVMQGFHDVMVAEGNERLGYLVQDEDRYLDSRDSESLARTVAERFEAQDYGTAFDNDALDALDADEVFYSADDGLFLQGVKGADGQVAGIKATMCPIEQFAVAVQALKSGHINTATMSRVMDSSDIKSMDSHVFENGTAMFDSLVAAIAKGEDSIAEFLPNQRATNALGIAKAASEGRDAYLRPGVLEADNGQIGLSDMVDELRDSVRGASRNAVSKDISHGGEAI